jgi:hypothetical protein
MRNAAPQALRSGEGHQRDRTGGGGRDVPTEWREDGGIELGVRQTGRMFELLGQGQRLLAPLLGIAQAPEKLGH